MNSNPLLRYQDLVDHPKLFLECSRTPLSLTGWVNPAKPSFAAKWLQEESSPLTWHEPGFKLADSLNASFLFGFLTGSLLVQEEAAMIPASLLHLRPGERVLDLCAAPGNKTAQLAVALGDTGTVVANDSSRSRLGVLQGTIDRLGLPNVLTTVGDARSFPIPDQGYDAVLADVPCSCEGTSRKNGEVLFRESGNERNHISTTQKSILKRAIECVRPGGTVVYSTCTYAPEENEWVVNEILKDDQLDVELLPISIPGFIVQPGITSWMGASFDSSVALCARVWPHINNTGGFFVALLRKKGPAETLNQPPPKTHDSAGLRLNQASGSMTRVASSDWPWSVHDFPQADLDQWATYPFSNKYGRLVNSDLFVDPTLSPLYVGMTGLNLKSDFPKFSTALAMKVGHVAKSGVASISPDELGAFWSRKSVPYESVVHPGGNSNTVIVSCQGVTIGLGSLRVNEGLIDSRFPKIWGGLEVDDRVQKLAL